MHKRIGFVVSIGSLSGLLFLRATGLCPQLMEHARHIHSAVSVCSEEVALCLRQSSWQTLRTQAIVIGQRAGEHRCRNTCINGGLDDSAPGILGIGKELGEIRIKCQGSRVPIGVGVGDAVEEFRSDNAAAAPDLGNGSQVDIPAVLLGTVFDLIKSLRIGDDLGSEQCTTHILDEGRLIFRCNGLVRTSRRILLCCLPQFRVA